MAYVRIKLPSPMRRFFAGATEVNSSGDTVSEVLRTCISPESELGQRLYAGPGGWNRHILVEVNGKLIRCPEKFSTPLVDGDTVELASIISE